mmetsp:Transcript_851/g.3469  ORF Transcript_851/g.3469 Transcript_851/m.3469 type:complete len:217 (-) Transcript_851:767-1417(-)
MHRRRIDLRWLLSRQCSPCPRALARRSHTAIRLATRLECACDCAARHPPTRQLLPPGPAGRARRGRCTSCRSARPRPAAPRGRRASRRKACGRTPFGTRRRLPSTPPHADPEAAVCRPGAATPPPQIGQNTPASSSRRARTRHPWCGPPATSAARGSPASPSGARRSWHPPIAGGSGPLARWFRHTHPRPAERGTACRVLAPNRSTRAARHHAQIR